MPPVAVLLEMTEFVIAGPVWAKSEIAPYAVPPDLPSPLPTTSAPLPPVAELCVMLLATIVSVVETPSIWMRADGGSAIRAGRARSRRGVPGDAHVVEGEARTGGEDPTGRLILAVDARACVPPVIVSCDSDRSPALASITPSPLLVCWIVV